MLQPDCLARHSGLWAIEPRFAETHHDLFIRGKLAEYPTPQTYSTQRLAVDFAPESIDDLAFPGTSYQVLDGLGIVGIQGAIFKGFSKFGGTSSVAVRKTLQAMNADAEVDMILLVIDSPGGMTAGLDQLANDIKTSIKPVWAAVDDLAASAAYWIASQASRVAVNRAGEVGSLGVYSVIRDTSGQLERQGIKLHVISTGEHKGTLVSGKPVEESALEDIKKSVEFTGDLFRQAIMEGRKMTAEEADKLWTGQVWPAPEALELGLVDAVEPLDATIRLALDEIKSRRKKNQRSFRF